MAYFQDQIKGNHCFGCGPDNPHGLRLKSKWLDDRKRAECLFKPESHHCSWPLEYVNGGVLATVVDCHSIWTAIAQAHKGQGIEMGEGDPFFYVTGSMQVSYLKPAPVADTLRVIAQVEEIKERTMNVTAEMTTGDQLILTSEVLAVRVGADW